MCLVSEMSPSLEEALNIIRSLAARCAALAQERDELKAHYEAKIDAIQGREERGE